MTRIQLTDGSGNWFDQDTAEEFKEDTRWDGNNHVSIATGSKFDHEALYLTERGAWILHSWSQWQGSCESYESIEEERAHLWLLNNGHHDSVPSDVVAEAEV